MNNIFSLYSVLAKNSEMKVPKNEEKGTLYLSLGIIALSCIMIPCCLIVGYVSYIITKALIAAGAPTGGLLAQIQIMSAFSMIFGILVIFNVLFFSSDREHLMPLPIKTSHILTAKFLYSYVAESIMEFRKLLCRARVCQRTAGTHVRNEHPFFQIKHFCRLSHEMHSCKDYGFRICLFRILRQCKAVSETIRNFLYLRQSVIMR